jgi:hypothetical protein
MEIVKKRMATRTFAVVLRAIAVRCSVGSESQTHRGANYASGFHGGRHFNPLPRSHNLAPLCEKSRNSGSGSCASYVWFAVRSPVRSMVMPAVVASPATVAIPARPRPVPVIPWAVAVIIPWRRDYKCRPRHRDRTGHYHHRRGRYHDRWRDDSHTRQGYAYSDAHADASLRGQNGRE